MVKDLKDKRGGVKEVRPTSSTNRRSRKKRRTEVSSSEEDSSSEEEEDEEEDDDDDADGKKKNKSEEKNNTILDTNNEANDNMEIDDLQMESVKSNNEKTEKDVLQTRLKLRQIDQIFKSNGKSNISVMGESNNDNSNTGISSDEWLIMMLSEYGDDIDTLRTTAADFRADSVSIIADLLRSTQDVFKEV